MAELPGYFSWGPRILTLVYLDSLSQDHAGAEEKYTLVLANPPFAGSLDYQSCAKDLLAIVKTKKTELLFLALFLRLLKPGGRAGVKRSFRAGDAPIRPAPFRGVDMRILAM